MLETLSRSLPFVVEALRTNFYGLGCPVYCGNPSLPSLFLALTLGFLLGVAACITLAWLLGSHLLRDLSGHQPAHPATSAPSTSRYSALVEYLDEHKFQRRRQRGT